MHKVSVIIPCYNAQKYILEALHSVLQQTYENIEIIVVDDASTDNSVQRIESINSSKIQLIKLKENLGYANALKIAIQNAKGTYIARMDADDVIVPSRIEKQVKVLNNNPNIAFVSSDRFRILPSGKAYIKANSSHQNLVIQTWNDVFYNQRIFVDAGTMFHIDKYNAVGGYRNYQKSGMDVDLWLRLLENYQPALIIAEPLYGHRLIPQSIIFSKTTLMANQIPRKLAQIRKEKSIAIGNDLQYINSFTISNVSSTTNENINVGMAAQCVVYRDFKGALGFFNCAVKMSNKNYIAILLDVLKKVVQKIKNPDTIAFRYK